MRFTGRPLPSCSLVVAASLGGACLGTQDGATDGARDESLAAAGSQALTQRGFADLGIGFEQPDPIDYPGRAAIFGFPFGNTTPHRRFWLNHGVDEMAQMAGPNDKVVAGDFKDLGRDQVLLINADQRAGDPRVILRSFHTMAALGSPPPAPLYTEAWGATALWDEWDDEEDLAFAADFLGAGYDQLLLVNRPWNEVAVPEAPRMRLVDLRGAAPVVVLDQTYAQFPGSDYEQRDDVLVVGDFRGTSRAQLLLMNGDPQRTGESIAIYAYPFTTPSYSRGFAQTTNMIGYRDAADAHLAGDFRSLGRDQLMLFDRYAGSGRVRIYDFGPTNTMPLVVYDEAKADSTLLNGWNDALGDRAFAGDFTGLGRDQVLFLASSGPGGRAMVADFAGAKPAAVRYLENWGQSTLLDGFLDYSDVVVAGRFTDISTAGILAFNDEVVAAKAEERVVWSPAELEQMLWSFRGRIIIPFWVDWTIPTALPVFTGTQVVGMRGWLGQRPILRAPSTCSVTRAYVHGAWREVTVGECREQWGIFSIAGRHVRIEGIHFIGPAGESRSALLPASSALLADIDTLRGRGLGLVITDNEIDHFTFAAFSLANQQPYRRVDTVDERIGRQAPDDVGVIRFVGNYVHQNHRDGYGYGVNLGGGAYVLIEGNVFDRNRHAVAAGGLPFSGYTARYNLVLQGGYTEEGFLGIDYWNQHFDVHGTGDGGYGGLAGEYFMIEDNTIRGEQDSRPAFMLRGEPAVGAWFRNNIVVHDDLDEAVSLKMSKSSTGIGEDHAEFNFHADPGNTYNTDRIAEIAGGDFDGDGRGDVFLATGTAWYASYGGETEWRYLRPSRLRVADLAFADMDSDSRTDVVWNGSNGYITYAPRGGLSQYLITATPAPLAQLRFFDMTGDGRTDIFRVSGASWLVFDGATGSWSTINSLGGSVDQMRFGQFDGSGGFDVAMAVSGLWALSGNGGRNAWFPMSGAHQASLATTTAIDVDRDGRTDLVFQDGTQWKWCRFGSNAPVVLRSNLATTDRPEHQVWGNFDGGGGNEALRWQGSGASIGPGLQVWRGPGTGDAPAALPLTMR
jgi:hypothetical protein